MPAAQHALIAVITSWRWHSTAEMERLQADQEPDAAYAAPNGDDADTAFGAILAAAPTKGKLRIKQNTKDATWIQ